MAGGHAQVMSAAEVSLALRVADATRADVAAALWEERSLVKTFGPRGTVHVLRDRRPAVVAGGAGLGAELRRASRGCPAAARRDRRDRGGARRGAARGGPHHRGARRVRRRGVRPVGGRGVDGGVRRLLAAVAAGARAGGGARGALLRAEPRPAGRLREPVVAGSPTWSCRTRTRRSSSCCAPISRRTARPRRRTWPGGWPRRRRGPASCSRAPTSTRSSSTASRRGCGAATRRSTRPRHRRCGCCRTSTRSRSARSRARLLFPGRASERALARSPGRQLPGAAARRRRRWGLAPEAVREAGGVTVEPLGRTHQGRSAPPSRVEVAADRRDRRGARPSSRSGR